MRNFVAIQVRKNSIKYIAVRKVQIDAHTQARIETNTNAQNLTHVLTHVHAHAQTHNTAEMIITHKHTQRSQWLKSYNHTYIHTPLTHSLKHTQMWETYEYCTWHQPIGQSKNTLALMSLRSCRYTDHGHMSMGKWLIKNQNTWLEKETMHNKIKIPIQTLPWWFFPVVVCVSARGECAKEKESVLTQATNYKRIAAMPGVKWCYVLMCVRAMKEESIL